MYVPHMKNMTELEDDSKYSVFILIFDSLSKLMFLRQVTSIIRLNLISGFHFEEIFPSPGQS